MRRKLPACTDLDDLASYAARRALDLVGAGASSVTWRGRGSADRTEPVDSLDDDPTSRRRFVQVPIRSGDAVLGHLEVMDPPRGYFPTEDRRLLEVLASDIAKEYARLLPAASAEGHSGVPLVGVLARLGSAAVGIVLFGIGTGHLTGATWDVGSGLVGTIAGVGIALALRATAAGTRHPYWPAGQATRVALVPASAVRKGGPRLTLVPRRPVHG
jgi:hypothetical protein